jgi:hypothetical protein
MRRNGARLLRQSINYNRRSIQGGARMLFPKTLISLGQRILSGAANSEPKFHAETAKSAWLLENFQFLPPRRCDACSGPGLLGLPTLFFAMGEAVRTDERRTKPVPLLLHSRSAASPMLRTRNASVVWRQASRGDRGSKPASTSFRQSIKTGAAPTAEKPSPVQRSEPNNSARKTRVCFPDKLPSTGLTLSGGPFLVSGSGGRDMRHLQAQETPKISVIQP